MVCLSRSDAVTNPAGLSGAVPTDQLPSRRPEIAAQACKITAVPTDGEYSTGSVAVLEFLRDRPHLGSGRIMHLFRDPQPRLSRVVTGGLLAGLSILLA